jgi:AraC-like DNA-binding protein
LANRRANQLSQRLTLVTHFGVCAARARALSLVTRTLSEVSLAVGFADQSIFTRAFTRWYGKTPHAYRLDDALGPT